MSGFIDYTATARETERALLRAGLALGVDWDDAVAVQALVRETLDRRQGMRRAAARVPHGPERQRLNLCALVVLRRRIEVEYDLAGRCDAGPAWRAISSALDRELDGRLAG
ncbi:hypothetical protein [Rubrivivax gelatinosus]|uniref:Uncharacterized protein n=1 Tax=Rubrivivax gelatinosus (strain NBRC 100245 / IL144) TaxID=983917 RepID=I0HQ08_RUBGI|nr:hypothetical protein [Rubrivivax gelatinosus]MBG6081689.1 hypothetical protein [Rubrivivax gelatinosus]BAL95095.1 hypothetical protein RGE_17540 [Rubrivivax gelatinosus IL144]